MSYGFQAVDAAGRVLLSDLVGGYGYKGSFVATPYTFWDYNMSCGATSLAGALNQHKGPWMCAFPKTQFPSPPLVMFELPTWPHGCALNGVIEESSQWVAYFLCTQQPVVHAFGVFTNEPRSTTGSGIQVFDSNGLLTFDSIVRRPLQLMEPPIPVTIPPMSFAVQDPNLPTYRLPTAFNDTVVTPTSDLPEVVLMLGQAVWYSLYTWGSSGGSGGSKGSSGVVIGHWWKLFGRDGNNIRVFGHQYMNCGNATSGELEPFGPARTYTGSLLLADKARYL